MIFFSLPQLRKRKNILREHVSGRLRIPCGNFSVGDNSPLRMCSGCDCREEWRGRGREQSTALNKYSHSILLEVCCFFFIFVVSLICGSLHPARGNLLGSGIAARIDDVGWFLLFRCWFMLFCDTFFAVVLSGGGVMSGVLFCNESNTSHSPAPKGYGRPARFIASELLRVGMVGIVAIV